MRYSSHVSLACRVTITGALLCLPAACGGPGADQVRSAVVVHAADATLTGAPMERWLVGSPYRPTDRGALAIAGSWIDQALLATAMEKGPSIDDSASIDAGILPDAERGMSFEFWQARAAARPPVTAAQIDSLATLDRVRIFQRLQVAVAQKADSVTMMAAVERARAFLKRAQAAGQNAGTFSVLAREASPDSGTRKTGGFLPAMIRSDVPDAIAATIWALHPGDVGPVMHGPNGFEILRRATKAESRAGLGLWLAPQLGRHADSLFVDSLTRTHHLAVTSGALGRLRIIAVEPVVAPDGPPLATWDGGALSPALVRRWLMMITPQERGQMTVASDSVANGFLRQLGEREMIIALAAPNGAPSAKARAALGPELRKSYGIVEGELRHVGGNMKPGDAATAYFDSTVAGTSQFRMLPGALAGVLRSRYPVAIDQKALQAVVKLAAAEWDVKQAKDTTHRTPATKGP